jgi:DivIVA domain-containing protein
VALDRQDIERRDFPIGRRGYNTSAVDAHLSALADEVDQLKRNSHPRPEPISAAAGEQVRQILKAAEESAAGIQRRAEDGAREVAAQAAADAQATRERATAQAREYVTKVSESTAVMLQRLDAMESELGATLEALRAGTGRLQSEIGKLDINLTDVREDVSVRPPVELEAEPGGAEIAAADLRGADGTGDLGPAGPAAAADRLDELPIAEAALPEAVAADVAEDAAEDAEGARLIALNMALNGAPREETDRYLAENFELSDRSTLLDEVYAAVDG